MASPEKEALALVSNVKVALGLQSGASDAEVLKEIADLVAIAEAPATPNKTDERKALAVVARGSVPFRRGGIVIPHDRVIVLDESTLDAASIDAILEEPNIIKLRSSDPFTPESEIERTRPSAKHA